MVLNKKITRRRPIVVKKTNHNIEMVARKGLLENSPAIPLKRHTRMT